MLLLVAGGQERAAGKHLVQTHVILEYCCVGTLLKGGQIVHITNKSVLCEARLMSIVVAVVPTKLIELRCHDSPNEVSSLLQS